ncbi:hypothetical protein Cob_v011022 [Colletotrichum orbiculare MAFF 240422]|uniref:Uncharacterized protein n=1 Tax=Colletotrichum orbiculare (strain 104-T / ATCC 96160 / CBS 514.97 / LARS 414 / MAFF 240422) TaxID=1213857 RepID=N4VCV8_COLOR|nr:hypothetical protein Cob_v011022 [Colletotrichum orbiculare MAFF 240422]
MASYNWLDRSNPSIVVPGAPPRWTPVAKPDKLREDSGVFYRDQNAARYPKHPMEPAVQAVMTMHPQPLEKQVDLVACGSTLGNLLRFVRGDERPFRMLAEVVDGVVHLIRRENSPRETIPNIHGYGHAFPDANTTWDGSVRGSESHQRILRYSFGGLGCIVRYEGDGYVEDKLESKISRGKHQSDKVCSVEEVIASLGDNEIKAKIPDVSTRLQVQAGGFMVPQSAVFDLKTRSSKRKGCDILGEELPRMWVSQIPNFVLAYHDHGVFNDIQVRDVSAEVRDWEKSMAKELSQLAALLHHIIGTARTRSEKKLEICRQTLDQLEIRAQTPGLPSVLGPDLRSRWGAWLAAGKQGVGNNEKFVDDGGDDKDDDVDFANGGSGDWKHSELEWSDGEDSGGDYTACSQDCSYCGRCSY